MALSWIGLISLLCFVPRSLLLEVPKSSDLPGVIFVPGDGGAQIEARLHKNSSVHFFCRQNSDWFISWLNLLQMVPGVIDCWTSNMVLEYDNITRTTHNPVGVDIRIPGFGDTATVEYLTPDRLYSYFAYIAETLVALGYERNVTMRGAPFDFRKAPNELSDYFSSLKSLTEELRESTQGPVALIAHSMGAPLLNYFLNLQTESWLQQNVLSVISLAGAWGGAVKAVKVYAAGDNLNSILSPLTLRTQQRTNPSLAFLLPDPELWGDEVLVRSPTANYTIRDMKQYLYELELYDAYEMYLDTQHLLNMSHTPPRVALHCLYGVGVPTVERIEYASAKYFPDYPVLVNGPGDGTVNLRSADLCSQYAKMQSEPIVVKSFDNTDHMAILGHKDVLSYIASVVTAEASSRALLRRSSVGDEAPPPELDTSHASVDGQATSLLQSTAGAVPGGSFGVKSGRLELIKSANLNSRRPESFLPEYSSGINFTEADKRQLSDTQVEAGISSAGEDKVTDAPESFIAERGELDNIVDAAVAKVDEAITSKWAAAQQFREIHEQLRQVHLLQKAMEQKMTVSHKLDLLMARLRDRM